MDELIKNVDVKEMGRRFKLVRQRLGLTQTEVANELDTTQLMIHRIEKGDNILSPLFCFWVRTSISRMSRFSARTMLSLPLSRQS